VREESSMTDKVDRDDPVTSATVTRRNLLDYPPSQTPGSFNLSKIEEQLRAGGGD
jgi:hypothetical protein